MTSGSKGGVWAKSAEIDRLVAGLGNKPGIITLNIKAVESMTVLKFGMEFNAAGIRITNIW